MMIKSRSDFFTKIALKDSKTKDAYEKRIKKWDEFCTRKLGKTDYIPDTIEDSVDVLQLFVNWFSMEDYNNQKKASGHSPNSVWNYASSIRKYLYYRGSPLTKDDFQEHIELPKKIEKELHGLTLDEIHKILDSLNYLNKTMFLCQLSSGMRIGEMVQLRKKHLFFDGERFMVKIPAKIAKFKRARTTFFSKEASSLLKIILSRLEDDNLIFGKSEKLKTAETEKGNMLREHLDKIGLGKRYEDTGNYEINTHSFRAYFITRVSRHDPNLAKFFAGEKGYLLQYDRMTDEEKSGYYTEFEKDLFIFDLAKKDEQIKSLRLANTEIAELREKQIESDKKMALIEELLFKSKRVS